MKHQILATAVLLFSIQAVKSQIAIGKAEVSNASVSLEFANTENRGLILPYIEDKSGITENGTVIYDVSDHKVKYLKGNAWFDLSVDATGTADISLQTAKDENVAAKVVIGTDGGTNTIPGVMVLSDTNKSMVLPSIANPHVNIITPAPGMMAYDTVKKQLAVYNGTVWSFWKP